MEKLIHLAYSPCPNDTFIFYHLVHKTLSENFKIQEELYDVEQLNEFAFQGKFEVTKLSFAAWFHVIDKYILLNSGSALGRGCGPILVKKKGKKVQLNNSKIAIPGKYTTANLLLNLFLKGKLQPIAMRYDKIIESVVKEEFDFGVIIHEERFTYKAKGLEPVKDLGEFWESETGMPIPLGAIAIRRDIAFDLQKDFENALAKSISLAYTDVENPFHYILKHSQNKSNDIVQKHIDLYVNEFTKDLGKEGRGAINLLYKKAIDYGIVNKTNLSLFLG